MYKCKKVADAKAWNGLANIIYEGDYKPIEEVDFNNLDYDPHGFECPHCLETCYTNERDIELIKGKINMNEEQKIGDCEVCGKKNVVVEASGYYVAFVCTDCLDNMI